MITLFFIALLVFDVVVAMDNHPESLSSAFNSSSLKNQNDVPPVESDELIFARICQVFERGRDEEGLALIEAYSEQLANYALDFCRGYDSDEDQEETAEKALAAFAGSILSSYDNFYNDDDENDDTTIVHLRAMTGILVFAIKYGYVRALMSVMDRENFFSDRDYRALVRTAVYEKRDAIALWIADEFNCYRAALSAALDSRHWYLADRLFESIKSSSDEDPDDQIITSFCEWAFEAFHDDKGRCKLHSTVGEQHRSWFRRHGLELTNVFVEHRPIAATFLRLGRQDYFNAWFNRHADSAFEDDVEPPFVTVWGASMLHYQAAFGTVRGIQNLLNGEEKEIAQERANAADHRLDYQEPLRLILWRDLRGLTPLDWATNHNNRDTFLFLADRLYPGWRDRLEFGIILAFVSAGHAHQYDFIRWGLTQINSDLTTIMKHRMVDEAISNGDIGFLTWLIGEFNLSLTDIEQERARQGLPGSSLVRMAVDHVKMIEFLVSSGLSVPRDDLLLESSLGRESFKWCLQRGIGLAAMNNPHSTVSAGIDRNPQPHDVLRELWRYGYEPILPVAQAGVNTPEGLRAWTYMVNHSNYLWFFLRGVRWPLMDELYRIWLTELTFNQNGGDAPSVRPLIRKVGSVVLGMLNQHPNIYDVVSECIEYSYNVSTIPREQTRWWSYRAIDQPRASAHLVPWLDGNIMLSWWRLLVAATAYGDIRMVDTIMTGLQNRTELYGLSCRIATSGASEPYSV